MAIAVVFAMFAQADLFFTKIISPVEGCSSQTSIACWNRHVLVALNFVSCDWWFQPAKAPREMLVIGCFLDVFGCVIFKLRLLEQHGTQSIRWQQPWQSSIVSLTANLKPWSSSLEYPLRDMNPRITSAQDMGCIQLGTAQKRYVIYVM